MRASNILITLALLVACTHAEEAAPTSRALSQDTELDGASLYQLDLHFEDQSGHEVELASLRGHPVLVTFFYSGCETMCPTIVHDVQEIEAGLTPLSREALRVVFVSFDGARDTRERLNEVVQERHIDTTRWSLVRGTDDDVRTLASTLGMTYRRTSNGEFAHAALLTILDAEGRVTLQREGTGRDAAPMRAAIEAIASPAQR